jgi:DNA polymerase
MGYLGEQDWQAAAASALDWWSDAGVDMLVADLPRDWTAKAEPRPVPAEAAAPAPYVKPAPEVAPKIELPDALEAFLGWRMSDAAPDAAWHPDRIGAEGAPGAEIMVVTDMPEGDGLLGGASGRLFDRMLAAIGLDRSAIYLVSVCVSRPTTGRVASEDEEWLGEILRHHLSLVSPKRVFLLGQAASRAILSMDDRGVRGRLHPVNHRGGQAEAVASLHPRFLLERPAYKAEAWKDLQLLIEGNRP